MKCLLFRSLIQEAGCRRPSSSTHSFCWAELSLVGPGALLKFTAPWQTLLSASSRCWASYEESGSPSKVKGAPPPHFEQSTIPLILAVPQEHTQALGFLKRRTKLRSVMECCSEPGSGLFFTWTQPESSATNLMERGQILMLCLVLCTHLPHPYICPSCPHTAQPSASFLLPIIPQEELPWVWGVCGCLALSDPAPRASSCRAVPGLWPAGNGRTRAGQMIHQAPCCCERETKITLS